MTIENRRTKRIVQ